MVRITSNEKSFLVEFLDSDFYLQGGSMLFPKNALSIVVDKSDIFTFKRSSNNDVIFSALLSDGLEIDGTTATKANIDELFESACAGATGGGGGADPETTVVDVEISQDGTEMDFVNESGDTVYSVDMTQYLTDLHVTGATLSGETLILYIAGSEPVAVDLEHMLDDVYGDIDILSGQCESLHSEITTKLPITRFESAERAIAETFADVYEQLSGSSAGGFIELTQAEYDALSGDVDPSKIYIITDAAPINLNNYTLTSTTATLEGKVNTISGDVATISGQVATKQDQLTAGNGITIDANNVISAQADMSNFYTKAEIDNAEQATSAALNDLNLRIIDLSGATADFATITYVDTKIGNINTALNNILNSN